MMDAPVSDFSAEAIASALPTRWVGHALHYWSSVGSTNDELKRLAEAGAPEGTLAIADEQHAGRGRMDRRWLAPPRSSLLLSLLFRPVFLHPTHAQHMTMICSLAAADAVAETTGLRPDLKWPNDLQLSGRKLAGVLTELGFVDDGLPASRGAGLAWTVVGVGLNVNVDFDGWPELAGTATSLCMALGRPVPRLPLLLAFLAGVETRYEALRAGRSPYGEWANRLATLGHEAKVNAPDGVYQGKVVGVDEAGALLLRRGDGDTVRILAGDVTLRT
jgi:BirA family biotin operon repressor/biotin-[acetyl-CoA-carboxylase] ligase